MGDSYRNEKARKKSRSGHQAPQVVRSGTEERAALREQYFRKPYTRRPGGHRKVEGPAQMRMF